MLFPIIIDTLPSLMSGKVHALLCRGYIKGRDRYDLVRYVSKKITPNIDLLHNALAQTNYTPPDATRDIYRILLIKKLQTTNTKQLLQDVERFLIEKDSTLLMDTDIITQLLEQHN